MAADEGIKEKYLGIIDDAKNKISDVKDEIAKLDDTEDGVKKSDIKNIGFSINSDGSVSFFAELEKSSADQKKRIEQAREDKKAQKKENEKEAKAKKLKEQQEDRVKRSVVRGNSIDELVKNIRAVDWDKIAEKVRPRAGGKIDFGVNKILRISKAFCVLFRYTRQELLFAKEGIEYEHYNPDKRRQVCRIPE